MEIEEDEYKKGGENGCCVQVKTALKQTLICDDRTGERCAQIKADPGHCDICKGFYTLMVFSGRDRCEADGETCSNHAQDIGQFSAISQSRSHDRGRQEKADPDHFGR